jgi:hypothetical protein
VEEDFDRCLLQVSPSSGLAESGIEGVEAPVVILPLDEDDGRGCGSCR